MSSTISLYGAYDRLNYGDILFPLVINFYLKQRGFAGDLRFYAPTRSDLRTYGGVQTRSARDLRLDARTLADAGRPGVLIVAGGEVLSATWGGFIASLLPNDFLGRVERVARRLIGDKPFAHLYARLFDFPSLLPFVISDDDFPSQKVAYNAVGGSHLSKVDTFVRNESFRRLAKVSYLSVRDNKTKSILQRHLDREVFLSPDCAMIISDMYPLSELESHVSGAVKLALDHHRPYVCFQSAAEAAAGHEDIIESQISAVSKTFGIRCIFFDIGKAAAHSDQVLVERLSTRKRLGEYAQYVTCENIFDVMAIIGNASVYCGTSLHGAITAISYDKPVVGLCPSQVLKLAEFLKTWGRSSSYRLAEYENLAQALCELLGQQLAAQPGAMEIERLKGLVYDNFDRMFQALELPEQSLK
ncbi:polysaccharide pyruvyl transferase family protein [Piscinibacter sakaiensis]|uniref:polysaccharide pyruvyl transferase family protein n=1 Tax=Piscinibacter sakaiensis TaxID=1547922 RepID=UPI003AAFC3F0